MACNLPPITPIRKISIPRRLAAEVSLEVNSPIRSILGTTEVSQISITPTSGPTSGCISCRV